MDANIAAAEIKPTDWRTFECPGCGDVEDIDVAEAKIGVTIYPCKCCGETLQQIDED